MSRNLGRIDCRECPAKHEHIELDESPREITQNEAGVYFPEYKGMIVAKAHCSLCHTLYLAWIKPAPGHRGESWGMSDKRFYDLSYQSAFNDEPAYTDMPLYKVEAVVTSWSFPANPPVIRPRFKVRIQYKRKRDVVFYLAEEKWLNSLANMLEAGFFDRATMILVLALDDTYWRYNVT